MTKSPYRVTSASHPCPSTEISTDMPNVWLKNQNGVSNYRMAYRINAASKPPKAWLKLRRQVPLPPLPLRLLLPPLPHTLPQLQYSMALARAMDDDGQTAIDASMAAAPPARPPCPTRSQVPTLVVPTVKLVLMPSVSSSSMPAAARLSNSEEAHVTISMRAARSRLAVGETVILLHPPSPFGRRFNRNDEGVPLVGQTGCQSAATAGGATTTSAETLGQWTPADGLMASGDAFVEPEAPWMNMPCWQVVVEAERDESTNSVATIVLSCSICVSGVVVMLGLVYTYKLRNARRELLFTTFISHSKRDGGDFAAYLKQEHLDRGLLRRCMCLNICA